MTPPASLGGSYEVEIVITDRNGVETRERRLFTRTRTLTPFNKPRILAQLGVLRDTVDATETPVFQGSYTKRINDFFELGSSLYGSDNISILQGSLKGIYGTAKFEADLSWSTGNDVGLYTQLENDFGWGYTFLSYNRTLTGHDDIGANDPDVFDAIAGQNDTLNFTFNTRIDRSTLTFRANRARNNGNTTYSYGPSLRHPIISGRPHRLDLNLDYLQTNTGNNSGAFLRYSYAPGGRWNYNNTSGLRRTNGNNEFSLTNAAQLNRETGRKTGWSGLLQNNARKSISSESMTTIANAEYINNTAKLNVNSRVTQNPSGQNTESLSLEAYSSVFYADGKLSMAASRGQEGAVLVADITGNAKGQSMRIVANGRTVGVAKVGERVAIYVEPFRTYTFSLQTDDKDSLVSFDTAEFIVTLYPGNVTTRQWLVRKAILAFGRLVDVQGNPITWKRIAGAHNTNTLTDGFGYFSLEYSGKETPYIASSSNRCTFAMPHIQSDTEYFTNLGDVVCL